LNWIEVPTDEERVAKAGGKHAHEQGEFVPPTAGDIPWAWAITGIRNLPCPMGVVICGGHGYA
jgi:hypothetical protein